MVEYTVERRNDLIQKLNQRVLTPYEQDELRYILESEKKNATSSGEVIKFVGVLLLLAALAALFNDDNDSKKRKRKR